jgi:glycosyltransferase involved in cell wall biosynthesis
MSAPVALFFRYGGFSHINLSLLPELRAAAPHLEIVDVDLEPLATPSAVARLRSRLSKALRYGPRRLTGRPVPADAALKTPFAFDRLGRIARQVTAAHGARVAITLQTQGLFDAATRGVPHVVYTDHAHLTNLGYAAFDPANLAADAWIARERQAFRRADAVLVMSEHVRRSLAEQYGVPESRLHNVGAGVNAPSSPRSARGTAPTALFVGVEWERKGGPELVEAVGRARAEFPGLRLKVVGCQPPGLPDYCDVVGRVPLAEVGDHMAAADLFCLPTRIEPFGIVVLEAMAARLPVVVPRLGAFPDFVRHGENGFLHEPLDVGSIAGTILEALRRRDDLPGIGEAARATVLAGYTWPKVAGRMAAVVTALARA